MAAAAANRQQQMEELQEDRERWVSVFSAGYGETITMQDVQDLKPNFVLSIYLQFVKNILNASLDNMKLIGVNSCEQMQIYPEVYEKTILMPRVAKLLAWFFDSFFGDDSFAFGDLLDPNACRTRHFFNYLVRFVLEYGEAREKLEVIRQSVERKREQLSLEEADRLKVAHRLHQMKKELAELQIQEEEELKQQQELSEELDRKQEVKAGLRQQMLLIKQANEERRSRVQAASLHLIELQEEREQLEGCVVRQDELVEVQQREQRVHQALHENEDKKRLLASLEGELEGKERMLALFENQILPQVEDQAQQNNEIALSATTASSLTAQQSRAMSRCEELDHQLSLTKQRLVLLDDKKKAIKSSWAKKKEGIESEIRAEREMLETLRRSEQDHEQADRDLTERLQETVLLLQQRAEEYTMLEGFCDDQFSQLAAGLEQHNLATTQGMQDLLHKLRNSTL